MLHVLGTNGVVHNGTLLKPNALENLVALAHGDKLQISKHTLSFSYTESEKVKHADEAPIKEAQAHEAPASEDQVHEAPASEAQVDKIQPSEAKDSEVQPSEVQPSEVQASSVQADVPKKVPTPKSTPRRRRAAAQESPITPRRQSARLKAKYSSPCLRDHVPTPSKAEKNESPIAVAQEEVPAAPQAESQRETEAQSQAKEAPTEMSTEATAEKPDKPAQATPAETPLPAETPTEPESKQLDVPSPLECSTQETNTVEQPAPQPQEPVQEATSAQEEANSEDADALEEAAIDDELFAPTTPQRASPMRAPMTLPRNMPRTPPLQWTPSKSRKISLRTATLLKRSAQYPLLPMSERRPTRDEVPSFNRSPSRAPRTSTGSRDMDLTSDYMRTVTSDPEFSSDEDEDEDDSDEIEKSLELSHSEENPSPAKTPERKERAPVLSQFLTPQQPKERALASRRLSNPVDANTPRLKNRSSWQWLRGLFSPKGQQDGASPNDQKEPSSDQKEEPLTPEARREVEEEEKEEDAVHDEFYDSEDPDQEPQAESYEPMDVEPVDFHQHVPDVSLTNTSWMYNVPNSPAPIQEPQQVASTPDMHVLKHMFAEQPCIASESAMSDFRHMVRASPAQEDMSLASAWNAMTAHEEESEREQPMHDAVEELPALVKSTAENAMQTQWKTKEMMPSTSHDVPTESHLEAAASHAVAPEESTPTAPAPASESVVQTSEVPAETAKPAVPLREISVPQTRPAPQPAMRASPKRASAREATSRLGSAPPRPMPGNTQDPRAARMTTRTVAQKKEPYVPVRRQLPARAAVPSLGSMATTATRAARVPGSTSTERTKGPATPETTGANAMGLPARNQSIIARGSSIPTAPAQRRPASNANAAQDTASERPASRISGPRTARPTRSARRL